MLYFWLFAEGFFALMYQIIFFRQLMPSIGSSNIVNGWIIGAFLGSMSLGYFYGGKTHKEPLAKLGFNFIYSAIIAGIGASSLVVSFYFEIMGGVTSILNALILYCLFVISPIAYLMGQSLPLILQLSQWGNNTAEKGGNALSLSTVGSMAGAIIPVTWITPIIGATLTLTFSVAIASFLGLFLVIKHKRKFFIPMLASIFSIFVATSPYLDETIPFTSTAHSDIRLIVNEEERLMFMNGLIMSEQNSAGLNSADYLNVFQHSIVQQRVVNKEILVLGAGGFMTHVNNPGNNNFTYVDIDKDLIDWAEKYFNLDKSGVNVIVDDARSYLIGEKDDSWDVIYLDVFGSRFSIPEHLMTIEFFSLINSRLKENGLLMFNMIMDPQFDSSYSKRIHSTVNSIFPYCHVIQVTGDPTVANMHYTCFANKKSEGIYVDDKHSISTDVWKERQR